LLTAKYGSKGSMHLNLIKCASIDAAANGYVGSRPAIN